MVKPKVSVIVPVYNVESYLEQCLNSIINQTLSEIEILIIDDGSTDNSPFICDKYAKVDSRIRVFHKENKGQGASRNYGMKHANGEYISFVDSDDFIEDDFLETLYTAAKKYNLDIVCSSYKKIFLNEVKKSPSGYRGSDTIESGKDFMCRQLNNHGQLAVEVWDDLFRNSFLKFNNISFSEGVFYEDEEFTLKTLLYAERVLFLNIHKYNYRQRSGSTVNQLYTEKHFQSLKYIINSFINLASNIEDEFVKKSIDKRLKLLFETLIYRLTQVKNISKSTYIDRKVVKYLQSNYKNTYREYFRYLLLYLNVELFFQIKMRLER